MRQLIVTLMLVLSVAGCQTAGSIAAKSAPKPVDPFEAPVSLNLPQLQDAKISAVVSDPNGHRPYLATVRYAPVAADRPTAVLYLKVDRLSDIAPGQNEVDPRFAAAAKYFSEKMKTTWDMDQGRLPACHQVARVGKLPDPLSAMSSEPGIDSASMDRVGEKTVQRVYEPGYTKHKNHVETVTVHADGRHCLGFAQCLPKGLTPDKNSVAVLTGFYCEQPGRQLDLEHPEIIVDGLEFRTVFIPRV